MLASYVTGIVKEVLEKTLISKFTAIMLSMMVYNSVSAASLNSHCWIQTHTNGFSHGVDR